MSTHLVWPVLRNPALMRICAALLMSLPALASSQTIQQQQLEQQGLAPDTGHVEADWNATLGAGVGVAPRYPGSDRDRAIPLPLISIAYRHGVLLGSDGLRLNLVSYEGFTFGPTLGYLIGRDASDDARLRGLGNLPTSVTAGVYGSYRVGPFNLSATVRQAVTDSSNGLLGSAQLDYHLLDRRVQIVLGPDLEFANASYEQKWFGITSGQSLQSGLPAYSPGGGCRDFGLHASISYPYSEHIILRGLTSVKRLVADAGNSPIVQQRTQTLIGVGIAYHF
jgi:outer membrane protein